MRFEVVLFQVVTCGSGLEVYGIENLCVKHIKIKRFMASYWQSLLKINIFTRYINNLTDETYKLVKNHTCGAE